jgi:hypothetical protein
MARRYNPGFVRIHYAQTYEHEQTFRLDLALSWLPMAPR